MELNGHPDLVPLAGIFLTIVGLSIIAGSFLPRLRKRAVPAGLILGAIATIVAGMKTVIVDPPTSLQLGSLAVAISVEIGAFVALMPRLHPRGPRAVTAGVIAIVGAHFILMVPAFGWPIAALGVLCVLNAALLWRSSRYPARAADALDGILKLMFGVAMIAAG
jgi:hypothetical protein